jgi:hypothetical protein
MYIGPDFKVYDENVKKIGWKVLEVIKKEEQVFGR